MGRCREYIHSPEICLYLLLTSKINLVLFLVSYEASMMAVSKLLKIHRWTCYLCSAAEVLCN